MNRTLCWISSATVILMISIFMLGILPATATVGWLPLSPEDLAMKDNPASPGADAMILYRESVVDTRKTSSDGDSDEEYFRIKVFTKEGTKQGHVEVAFDKEWEDISYVTGRTIRPDGSIVKFDGQVLETTAVRAGERKVLVKTFTLPDVQPGSIIEYKYQRQSKPHYVHNLEWVVSASMFTREGHFTYIPYTGYGGLGLSARSRFHNLPAGTMPKLQVDGSYKMDVQNVPALQEEALMPPEGAIAASVEFYYEEPNEPSESDPAEKFWNNYAKKWNGELEHFIDKRHALETEAAKTVGPADPPETKLRKIYARVLQLRNLNMEDYRTQKENKAENLKPPSNAEEALNRGYANGRQINFLFVGLARAAGFDATEIFVQPRNIALYFAPNDNEANRMRADIVWVHAGSQDYYLDPGARYFSFGIMPWYETDAGGIRVTKRGGEVVTSGHAQSADATVVRDTDLTVSQDGSIAGTIQVDFTGEEGGLLRLDSRKEDETGRTKDLEDRIKSWLPVGSDFQITKIADWDDAEKPVHVEGTVSIPSFAKGALRRMLMPLEVFKGGQSSLFAPASRVNLIYFHYPYQEIDDLRLHLPSGFRVETLPQAQKLDLGAAAYEISAASAGDGVEVKRHLSVNGFLFSKDAYPTLRAFFGTVRTNDNAQMVLQNNTPAQNK
jgi:Domain of Unknown Function with PDB structure (DUF3857)